MAIVGANNRVARCTNGNFRDGSHRWVTLCLFGMLLSISFGIGESVGIIFNRYSNLGNLSPLNALTISVGAVLWNGFTAAMSSGVIIILLKGIELSKMGDRVFTVQFRYYAMFIGMITFPLSGIALIWANKEWLAWLPSSHLISLSADGLIVALACILWFFSVQLTCIIIHR